MRYTLRYSAAKPSEVNTKLNRLNASSLFTAASSGELEKMKFILRDDVLGLANICLAEEGHGNLYGDIVDTTLTQYLDACNKSGADALEGTKLLFKHGADISVEIFTGLDGDSEEDAAIKKAIWGDMLEVTSFLLAQGARCPLVHDCQSVEMIKILMLHGADVRARDASNATLLFSEVDNQDEKREILEFALSHGVDINSVNLKGMTALNAAACQGNAPTVQYLCEMGASLDIPNKTLGHTPLASAFFYLSHIFLYYDRDRPPHINKRETYRILQAEPSLRHWKAMAMGFAMGLHPRLGAGSRVLSFDEEVLRMILKKQE